MKYILIGLLAILPTFATAQSENPTLRRFAAEKLFQRGLERYQQRDFAGAISLFNQVVLQDPDHPEVYEFRGEAYYMLGDYRAAVDDYNRALEQQPKRVELLNSAGVAAAQLRLYGAAIQYFKKALKINPSHEQAKANLAEANRRYAMAKNGGGIGGNDPFTPGTDGPAQVLSIIDLRAESISRGPGPGSVDFDTPREQAFGKSGGTGKPKPERVYDEKNLIVGGQSDPQIRIVRLRQARGATEIALKIKNTSKAAYPLRFAQANSSEAFFLTDAQFKYIYDLKTIRGPKPRRTGEAYELRPGEEVLVVCTFQRMDDDVKIFHLIEGETPREGAWNFWYVRLMP